MASWLGYARTNFTHADTTIDLPGKNGKSIDLAGLCESVTPPCKLNPLLFNGHLQTMWTVIKGQDVPIHYKRKIFNAELPAYKGTFAVDFVSHEPAPTRDDNLPPRTVMFSEDEFKLMDAGSKDNRPMLVVLHGLSGGSHELYLRHVLAPLVRAPAEAKSEESAEQWEACVINSRGCAKSQITSTILYNARATWDIRQTVKWLRKRFPNRPLFGVGFSLGGNILTNYLGEEGDACELKAAVVLSNPWNLNAGGLALQRTWIGLEVYSKAMGAAMKQLFERHVDEISKNPAVDINRVRSTRYLHEFDRALQGPTWGYPTEGAYYRDASSTDSLLGIRIPLLAIHAEDDPIAASEALPWIEVKQNPYVVLCTTSMGGHLSWFEFGGTRWFVKPTTNFFRKFLNEVNLDELSAQKKTRSIELMRGAQGAIYSPLRRKLHLPDE